MSIASPPHLQNVDIKLLEQGRRQAREQQWRRGVLDYKRHATQRKINSAIVNAKTRQFYLNCSRRLGKSYELVLTAFEVALRRRNARILYLAPQAKDAANICTDLALKILEDCPIDLKPKINTNIKEIEFPNGSLIRLYGTNSEHAQFLRGGAADLIVLDECGIMDDLKHVLQDVCVPMTLTTRGRIILASTPPRTPGHESAGIFERLSGLGASITFTLLDAPHLAYEDRVEALSTAGERPELIPKILAGEAEPETTTALREYWCRFVTDAESAVVPEYSRARKQILQDVQRPAYFDCYVAMDPGFNDRTGLLFGYWDFLKARLVVEDELLLQRANTSDIAKAIQTMETSLWGNQKPFLRVSDVDLRLIADLHQMHKLTFAPTEKQNSLDAINKLRNWVQSGRLAIHPRCKNLDRQLTNAIWNTKATDFDRTDVDGHFDLVAALKYMVRNVIETKNPFPKHWVLPGWPGGPPAGSYLRPTLRKKSNQTLYADTPIGRKLAKKG